MKLILRTTQKIISQILQFHYTILMGRKIKSIY